MARPSRKNPVIMPSQVRSKETFDAILQATTYLLQECGFQVITSNAIAERAGVNINSFYQYFLDKDAALRFVAERHIRENEVAFSEALARLKGQDSESAYQDLIQEMIELFSTRPAFRREILLNMALLVGPKRQHEVRKGLAEGLVSVIPVEKYPGIEQRRVASLMVVHTFMSATVVFLDPKYSSAEREMYRKELKTMLCRYVGVN
jgi:AcrR family transcriptional regulator